MRTVSRPLVVARAAAALVALAAVCGLTSGTARVAHAAPPQVNADANAKGPPDAPADVAFDDTFPTEIAGEIAIDLRDDASDADVAAFATRYGISVRPNSAWSDHDRIEVADVDPATENALLDRMEHDPLVEHAEPMALYRALFVPNDPLYASKQWHLTKVSAEQGWNYTCGRGVTVAVIDTGVACFTKGPFSKGTDLEGTRCEGGFDFVNNGPEAADDHGHGTHVAGTIAQATNNGVGTAGLAFCATLMPIKVLSKQGFGTVTNVAEGIRFAADHGAQIINMSLGGPTRSKIIADAVQHAIDKGVLVVAAAGNSGRSVGYPAAYKGVLAVSATDAADKIAWFSSRGPEVGIGAPGVAVTQQTICEGGQNKCELFGTFNGTSMAAPHVAGAAAMVLSMGVTHPDAVRAALEASARPKDEKSLYGAGILDAGPAIAHAHWLHVGLRLAALALLLCFVAARIKKARGELALTPLAITGALVGAVGLAPFAPLLHLGSVGALRPAVELLMRPFGEWDMLMGAGLHRWLPLASALPVMVGVAFLFGSRRLRPGVGGFAIGTAALMAQIAFSGDVAFGLGTFALRLWMVANIALCLWLGKMCLNAKNA